MKSTLLAAVASAALAGSFCSVVRADMPATLCDEVFKNRAFNTYESSSQQRLSESLFKNFCSNLNYTESDIRGRATGLGVDYKNMSESLGLSYSDSSSSARFVNNVKQMCDTQDSRLFQESAFSERQQLTDVAVNAWQACTARFSDSLGAISEAQSQIDRLSITIYNGSPRPADLKILSVSNNVKCYLGRTDVTGISPGNLGYSKTIGLTCINPAPTEREFYINTNQSGAQALLFRFLGRSTLRSTQRRFAEIERRIAAAEKEIRAKGVPLGTIAYFQSADCPAGWAREGLLDGRYAVGTRESDKNRVGLIVGQHLSAGENRPSGDHQHDYVVRVPGYDREDKFMNESLGRMGFQDGNRKTSNSGLISGTNAPYALLSACRKL